MIRVTITLAPANGQPLHQLGTAEIANDGTGTATHGNYAVSLCSPGSEPKSGTVRGFPRKAKLGAWDLLYRALRDVVGARNEPSPEEAELDLIIEPYDAPGRYLCSSASRVGKWAVDLLAWGGNGACGCEHYSIKILPHRKRGEEPPDRYCRHIAACRRKHFFENMDVEAVTDRLIALEIERLAQQNGSHPRPMPDALLPDDGC